VASAAVPGLLPPAKVGDEHFLDGGIVNSIPLGRAVALGADVVYVLQVGRIDRPLQVPKRPWEVARVSFEIARRHRFSRELAEVPDGVVAHVLPARARRTGRLDPRPPRLHDRDDPDRGDLPRQPGVPRPERRRQ
jgi:NTE family protein